MHRNWCASMLCGRQLKAGTRHCRAPLPHHLPRARCCACCIEHCTGRAIQVQASPTRIGCFSHVSILRLRSNSECPLAKWGLCSRVVHWDVGPGCGKARSRLRRAACHGRGTAVSAKLSVQEADKAFGIPHKKMALSKAAMSGAPGLRKVHDDHF